MKNSLITRCFNCFGFLVCQLNSLIKQIMQKLRYELVYLRFSVCTHSKDSGLGVTEQSLHLYRCAFCALVSCVLVRDPSVLFQQSKSHRSSVERNAIYIFHYPPSAFHLSPSFLLSLSDLISQLLSSLIPPVLALLVLVSFLSIPPFSLLSLSFFLFIHFFLASTERT